MKAPVAKLKHRDIVWLSQNKCAHSVTYLEHYNCFLREKPDAPLTERIGFLDIETSNLKASFGYVISYCIKVQDGPLLERVLTPKEIQSGDFDADLLRQFNRDISGLTRLAVYWGKDRRHDIPFLRTRALKHHLDFPMYRDIMVVDLYDWAKNKLSLHSHKLEVVCRELSIEAKGHPLNGEIWVRAMAGKQDALDYILEHNREDVICLEPLYSILEPFMRNLKVTI